MISKHAFFNGLDVDFCHCDAPRIHDTISEFLKEWVAACKGGEICSMPSRQMKPECRERAIRRGTEPLNPSRETAFSGANGDRGHIIFSHCSVGPPSMIGNPARRVLSLL